MFWRNSLPELKLTEAKPRFLRNMHIYLRQHFPKCSMYVGYLPTLGETWSHSKGNVGKYSIHEASGFSTFRCIENRCWPALEVTAEYVIPCQPCTVFWLFLWYWPPSKKKYNVFYLQNKSHLGFRYSQLQLVVSNKFWSKTNILKKLGIIPFRLILQLGLRAPYLQKIEVSTFF